MNDKLAGDLIDAYNKGFQDGHESGLKDWAAYEDDMKIKAIHDKAVYEDSTTTKGENKSVMIEYDKYIRNVWKAEAVQEIAEFLKDKIEMCNRDIRWYNERISERLAAIENSDRNFATACEDPENDFLVTSHKKSIEQVKVKIELWNQLLNVIDAELAF